MSRWLKEKAHPWLVPYIAFMVTLEFIVLLVR